MARLCRGGRTGREGRTIVKIQGLIGVLMGYPLRGQTKKTAKNYENYNKKSISVAYLIISIFFFLPVWVLILKSDVYTSNLSLN